MVESIQDLTGLDRDVARAARAVDRFRDELARGPEAGGDSDPFDGLRHTAALSTVRALEAFSPSVADAPLRDALVRWVRALTDARVGVVDDIAVARAMAAPSARYEGEPPRRVTWRQAWRGVVEARTAGHAQMWIMAAADVGPKVADAIRARASRRCEVARRMGYGHPWELDVGVTEPVLRQAAEKLLAATEDVSHAIRTATFGPSADAAGVIQAALARDAGDGWPARLTARWLEQCFGEGPRGLPIELPLLPQPLGAATFARALCVFGQAVRAACVPSSLPFALGRKPASVDTNTLACVFGSLAFDPTFHSKALGLSRRIALSQARILAKTALLQVRLEAARIVLGSGEAPLRADLFAEIGVRLFGSPLDSGLRGAWPTASRDQAARLVGLLNARAASNRLRDRFDIDWFRNPRAWTDLREQGARPADGTVDGAALDAAAGDLGRAFEEALG